MSERTKQHQNMSISTEAEANVTGGAKVLATKLVLSAAAASVAETGTLETLLYTGRLKAFCLNHLGAVKVN